MGFSSFIAKRYYWTKSKWSVVNIISRAASFVLIIAICSFFVVLSVFSGLKSFGENYSKAFDPEIKISDVSYKHFIINDSIYNKVQDIIGVFSLSKILEEKVLVQNEEKNDFAYLYGVDHSYNSVVQIDSVITLGKWLSPFSKKLEAVVSFGLADNLNLGMFNYGGGLTIIVPSKKLKNNFFQKRFSSSSYMVSGLFNSVESTTQKTVFTSISNARQLLGLDKAVLSSIIVKTNNKTSLVNVANEIKKVLGNGFSVKTRQELNETYYKMLNAEGLILNLVLGLILIIAMFNTVGAVIILIVEKQKDIKTLYKLGAKKSQINSLFFKHGLYLSYSGGSVGLVIGCVIVFIQEQFGLILLSGTSIPYPVVFDLENFITVIGWLLIVGVGGSFLSSFALKKIKQ